MSGPFGSSQWMYQSAAGFYPTEIEQSLRFNDDDSAYLSWTPASAGNRKTWTWSGWVKRGNLGTGIIFSGGTTSSDTGVNYIGFVSDQLIFAGISTYFRVTSQVLRDPSAWYHIVVAFDSTQVTADSRCLMYVNGAAVTAFATNNSLTLNADYGINQAAAHRVSSESLSGGFGNFDGYLAEVNFIDGQALDPTDFGEFKSGVWVAKSYAGSYGTNGFYLNFSDSANIGDDLSGNANDWTANNLVATDVVLDSPTNNFATFNPIDKNDGTYSNGNLQAVTGTVGGSTQRGSFYFDQGKWYYEFVPISNGGITAIGFESVSNGSYTPHFYQADNGQYYNGASASSYGATFTTSDIIGVAIDADNQTVEFFKNGVSQGVISSGSSGMTAGDEYVAHLSDRNVLGTMTGVINFGQDSSFAGNKTAQGNTDDNGVGDFYYAPPSGYLALCSANLPTPAIDPAQDDVPSDYFNTVLYTGNGSTQSISVGWQPDFVWLKRRDSAGNHFLLDAVRGATKQLYSDLTLAEETRDSITSFTSTGYDLGNYVGSNGSSYSMTSWNWLAGNGTSSNTDGSITSTVSVNQKAGFSVVSYTGTGSNATVGHGLGAVPACMIIKERDNSANWIVYHQSLTADKFMILNLTNAEADFTPIFNDTEPTSSVFTVGTNGDINGSTDQYIAYVFAPVESYSAFGSYTGNGSTDGPFIFTNHRPAWIMVKRTDSTGSWVMYDDNRDTYNPEDEGLFANLSDAETTQGNGQIDFLSNGFKLRNTGGSLNTSGGTYVFMSFSSNPFKYANAR